MKWTEKVEVKYTLEIKILVKIGTSERLLELHSYMPDKISQLEILSVATRFIEPSSVNQHISIVETKHVLKAIMRLAPTDIGVNTWPVSVWTR